jgi:hypothetical protein
MSSREAIFASPRASNDPFKSVLQAASPSTCDRHDTEMNFLLTSIDDHRARATSRSRSKSPICVDEMSNSNSSHNSFQSARERSERLVGGNDNVSTAGMSSSWSRNNPHNNNAVVSGNRSRNASRAGCFLSAVMPGFVEPDDTQLNVAYGYAIRRDDGSYTRLIRADDARLALADNPSRPFQDRQGPEGLIILPPPRQPSPGSRRPGDDPFVSAEVRYS